MNPLWPAGSRASRLNPRTLFPACHQIDSLAVRLAQRSTRAHAISTLLVRRRDVGLYAQSTSSRVWQFSNATCRIPAGIRTFASRRIITRFEDLPRYYNDQKGLIFRTKDLSKEETIAIFGKIIDVNSANRLLRVLHGRRVAGTLGDPSFGSPYEAKAIEIGLQWLRKHAPVDEVQCAGLRAEKELADMEEDIVSDAERLGLYQPNEGYGENVYGEGVLDRVRKANEAKFEAMQKAEKLSQADEIRQNTGTLQTTRPGSQVELLTRGQSPRLKYYLERAKVLPDTPPEMSEWERLWPSGLFTITFIAGCILFATVYTPPDSSSRLWPDVPPAAATLISIIIINSIVLGVWHFPPAFRLLNKYFIITPGYPRALSLLGSVFSHQSCSHVVMNMVAAWYVGVRLHEEVGRGNFIAIYLSCGVFGSFTSLACWVLRNNLVTSSLGASAAICGIVATYLLLNSSEKITLFGVFPPEKWPSISALAVLVLMVGLDVSSVWKLNKIVIVDHWAHLGGYAAGAVAAGVVRRQVQVKKERELERRRNSGIGDRIKEGRLG